MAVWGYVRVSSIHQNVDRQVESLLPYVTTRTHLIIEKQSGKDFERPKYLAMKELMQKNDILVIQSLDRLGRNYEMIKEEWQDIIKKGVKIKVLDNELLDTTRYKENDLLSDFLSNIVLEVLSFVADNERKKIKERQSTGIAIAKKKGVKFGRPAIKYPKDWEKYYIQWKEKKITSVAFMNVLDLKKTTFYKLLKEYEKIKK